MSSGPRFFVPYVDDSAKADKVWQGIKTLMEDRHGWPWVSERRIFRLHSGHGAEREAAQVGEPHRHGHPQEWDYDKTLETTEAREVVGGDPRERGRPLPPLHTQPRPGRRKTDPDLDRPTGHSRLLPADTAQPSSSSNASCTAGA